MNRAEVLAQSRLAGQVIRYHTWPVHRQQSVGEHTWQILRLYWLIFGPPSSQVTTSILWHDAGELCTGDPPFPFKSRNPNLKAMIDALEEEAVEIMGGNPRPALSGEEKRRVKACDLIDMVEYGLHEYNLGNKYAEPIIQDVTEAVHNLWRSDPLHKDDPDYYAVVDYLVKHVYWGDYKQCR